MNDPIPLDLPEGTKVFGGGLYADERPEDWDEDIVWLELPNGIGIDVGRYGHGAPNSKLHVVVYQNDNFYDQIETVDVCSAIRAAQIVELLAKQYVK